MGKGVKGDPCQREACAIQDCLKKNGFQESKCQDVIDALYKCCEQYQNGESVVCSGIRTKGQTHTMDSAKPR